MKHSIITDSQLICRECGKQMQAAAQPNDIGGYIALITCWRQSCLMYGVTLSIEQYSKLTESQVEAYREMNRFSRPKYMEWDSCE